MPFPDLTPIWPVLNLSQKYISLLKVGFIVTKLCPLVLVHLCRVEHVWMLAGNILTSFLYCLSHYLFNWAQLGPFAFAVTISSVTKFLHGHRSTFYRLKTTQFLQAIKVNYCTISQWALDYHDLDQQHSPHLCDDNQIWKQGNYSLRRPPKLSIPQAVIGRRWAAVNSNLYKQPCMCVCMTIIPALTPS